jgi:hypothetical protein
MDLITKIVILATAIVGLYKAATFSRGKPDASDSTTETTTKKSRAPSSFSALFELVGVLLFMLAFPAFIWGFSWITRNIAGSSSAPSQHTAVASVSISAATTPSELAYVAADSIPNTYEKTAALSEVVALAMKAGEFKTAIAAATAIPNTNVQTEQLKLVLKAIQSAAVPNTSFQGTLRDKAAQRP